MIKTNAQRERTVAQLDGLHRPLAAAELGAVDKRATAIRSSYDGMIRQLEEELREYDQLKSGQFTLPPIDRLDAVALFIVKMRIAKGISQTELAKRLGASKQVVSRHEEDGYQGVSITRLQEILNALGVKTCVLLSA